jgi:hypothetical protein
VDRALSPVTSRLALYALYERRRVDPAAQVLLSLQYRRLVQEGRPLPTFDQVGFSSYSQNEEDGILLFLFAVIGTTGKTCVELGAGDGTENNTANLIVNHGWTGLMVDGDEKNVGRGRDFYATCPTTWVYPPVFAQAWIDAEGVDRLITGHGFQGEIDLLSIDIDGNDYWVWKAIGSVQPRVVVIECHNIWPADRAVTVPYRADFDKAERHPDYSGASLLALVKLGRAKGYRLVGCNRYGFNAFFVRQGIGEALLPEVAPETCLRHPQALQGQRTRLLEVKDLPWMEV